MRPAYRSKSKQFRKLGLRDGHYIVSRLTSICRLIGATRQVYLAEAYCCHQVDTTPCSVLPPSVIRVVRSAYFDIKVVAPMTLAATRGAKRMWGGGVDSTVLGCQTRRREHKNLHAARGGCPALASHDTAVTWSSEMDLCRMDKPVDINTVGRVVRIWTMIWAVLETWNGVGVHGVTNVGRQMRSFMSFFCRSH
jgi:hypothetical protein